MSFDDACGIDPQRPATAATVANPFVEPERSESLTQTEDDNEVTLLTPEEQYVAHLQFVAHRKGPNAEEARSILEQKGIALVTPVCTFEWDPTVKFLLTPDHIERMQRKAHEPGISALYSMESLVRCGVPAVRPVDMGGGKLRRPAPAKYAEPLMPSPRHSVWYDIIMRRAQHLKRIRFMAKRRLEREGN